MTKRDRERTLRSRERRPGRDATCCVPADWCEMWAGYRTFVASDLLPAAHHTPPQSQ